MTRRTINDLTAATPKAPDGYITVERRHIQALLDAALAAEALWPLRADKNAFPLHVKRKGGREYVVVKV